jgi:RNA polymerase sigma factor (sigma-70 family)
LKDYQKTLFPYAYNILGSSEDAKDAIQDVMTKYISAPKEEIENEVGYLIRGVINQSINIKSRNKKMTTVKAWLPEPIATENADRDINRNEIISYSMLVLLEYLNPKERAAFILKEAFDYSHEEIANTLSISIENSRKLLSRAKIRLETPKEKINESSLSASAYLESYIAVIKNGDTKALEKMLSEEISVTADGGGKVKIVRELTIGIEAASELIFYLYDAYHKSLIIQTRIINHQPALLFYNGDTLTNCQVFEFEKNTNKIRSIYSVVDPEKLKNIFLN